MLLPCKPVRAARGTTQISLLAEGGIPGALPKSCERVGIIWTGQASMGRTAGFGAFPHMKRLFLQGFRCACSPASYRPALCCSQGRAARRGTGAAWSAPLLRP